MLVKGYDTVFNCSDDKYGIGCDGMVSTGCDGRSDEVFRS